MNNFQLIKEVAARKALWDRLEGETGDVAKREELWEEVAEKLKTSTYVVRTRWKNLRDSYRRLITKQIETGEEPKWRYFKAMHFLKGVISSIKPRTLDISVPNGDKRSAPLMSQNYVKSERSDDEMMSFSDSNVVEHDENGDFESILGIRKRKYLDCDPQYIEVQASVVDDDHIKLLRLSSNDEDLQFLLSLHPHLKGVPSERKLPLRMKIENVIHEEVYNDHIKREESVNDDNREKSSR